MPLLSETHRAHCWHTLEPAMARYRYGALVVPVGQTLRTCCKCPAYEVVPAQ